MCEHRVYLFGGPPCACVCVRASDVCVNELLLYLSRSLYSNFKCTNARAHSPNQVLARKLDSCARRLRACVCVCARFVSLWPPQLVFAIIACLLWCSRLSCAVRARRPHVRPNRCRSIGHEAVTRSMLVSRSLSLCLSLASNLVAQES